MWAAIFAIGSKILAGLGTAGKAVAAAASSPLGKALVASNLAGGGAGKQQAQPGENRTGYTGMEAQNLYERLRQQAASARIKGRDNYGS